MRKHKADYWILVLTLILMAVGLVVIFSIGPQREKFLNTALGYEKYKEGYFFGHQLITVVLSVGAFFIAYKLPLKLLHKFSKWIMILALGLNAVLAILAAVGSSLAVCQLGGCRWIGVGQVSFQPAEFLKLALVIYLADLMARRKEEGELESFWGFWWPFIVVSAVSLFFVIVLQKDMGTGLALIGIILGTLFISGVRMRYFLTTLAVVGVVGILAIVLFPHRMERLMTFSGDGNSDSAYHLDNALIAIGTGGWTGVGVGNSVQATGYLPESINDSVFAVMGETFGFIGLTVVILTFVFLLSRLLRMVPYLEAGEGMMVAGVWAWIAVHLVVNIASMTGLIPLTGITLPLLSHGGTSMLFMGYSLGLCMQISRYTHREIVREKPVKSFEYKSRREV